MNFNIIFLILGLQVVLALIVIAVLKKLLDRELVESALEQFEVFKYQGDLSRIKKIAVVGHKEIRPEIQTRFKNIAARRFKDIPIDFSTDMTLKGGVKVLMAEAQIDCTLSDRLQRLFGPHR
jgi:F0F1-type ATP synthase delta subunit